MQDDDIDTDLTPKQVVDRLDRYIVGQVGRSQGLEGLLCSTLHIACSGYMSTKAFWASCSLAQLCSGNMGEELCIMHSSHTGGCEEGCGKCSAQQMAEAEAHKPNEGMRSALSCPETEETIHELGHA